ncbi:hypothetical protein LEMLEM_LOCUS14172 [Lemmus lemmus]
MKCFRSVPTPAREQQETSPEFRKDAKGRNTVGTDCVSSSLGGISMARRRRWDLCVPACNKQPLTSLRAPSNLNRSQVHLSVELLKEA